MLLNAFVTAFNASSCYNIRFLQFRWKLKYNCFWFEWQPNPQNVDPQNNN